MACTGFSGSSLKDSLRGLLMTQRLALQWLARSAAQRWGCRRLVATSAALPRPRRRQVVSLLGLCGCASSGAFQSLATHAAAEPLAAVPPPLPMRDISSLHEYFGGDSSIYDNRPMPQRARSGGTISALSVQIPALEKLLPYLNQPAVKVLDLGFGSGIMIAMILAVAGEGSRVTGVDLADKIALAQANLLGTQAGSASQCPFVPFDKDSFSLLGGDAFEYMLSWEKEDEKFDVLYAGCSMDPGTEQLRVFLGRLKAGGAAVFNLGSSGRQGMYFVADEGRVCELLMRVNFMMAESPITPLVESGRHAPLEPQQLGQWIRQHVFNRPPAEL